MAKSLHIGVGGLGASKEPGAVLKTMALGSCIAIVMLDPKERAIGMVHIALPDSSVDRLKAMELPGYFADTGMPALLLKMAELGCDGRGHGMIIKLIGGANILDVTGVFNIGKRNALTIKKLLFQFKLAAASEDIGGDISRTVQVFQETGKVEISCPSIGKWEI